MNQNEVEALHEASEAVRNMEEPTRFYGLDLRKYRPVNQPPKETPEQQDKRLAR